MSKVRSGIVIAPPASEADINRFLKDVEQHPDTIEVTHRIGGLEAEVEKRGGTKVTQWSHLRHCSRRGFAKAREKIHRRLLDMELLDGARCGGGLKPTAIIMLGPPGSGKTQVGVPFAKLRRGVEFTKINADDVKEALPEYEGWNACGLHDESAYVAEGLIKNEATAGRYNLILDITGRNEKKVEMAIGELADYGYNVYLILMDLPPWQASFRAWDRFQKNPFGPKGTKIKPGRYVPPRFVFENMANRPKITYDLLKDHGGVAGYCRLDATVPEGSPPSILEQRGGW